MKCGNGCTSSVANLFVHIQIPGSDAKLDTNTYELLKYRLRLITSINNFSISFTSSVIIFLASTMILIDHLLVASASSDALNLRTCLLPLNMEQSYLHKPFRISICQSRFKEKRNHSSKMCTVRLWPPLYVSTSEVGGKVWFV